MREIEPKLRSGNAAFTRALEQQLDTFTPEERANLGQVGPEGLFAIVREYDQRHAKTTVRKFSSRVKRMMSAMEPFTAVIDALTEVNSLSKAVWGSFQALLKVCSMTRC